MTNPVATDSPDRDPLRIAFISPFLCRLLRGIERFTIDLASELARQGEEVHLITWGGKSWPWGGLPEGIHVHKVALPKYFKQRLCSLPYRWIIDRIQPDITNAFFTWQGEDAAIRKAKHPGQVVLNLHFPADIAPNRYEQYRQSATYRRATGLIAVNEYVEQTASTFLDKPIEVIPNAVYPERFQVELSQAEARQKFSLPESGRILLSVAALEPRKRIAEVIRALPLIRQAHPDLNYVVAGEGDEKGALQALAAECGVADAVHLLGRIEEVPALYRAADCFTLLSDGEAFGLVVLEAMAAGLPLVLAERQPFTGLVTTEQAAFVDGYEPKTVATAISDLLSNPDRIAAMRTGNPAYVSQHYTWPAVARRYREYYRKLVISASSTAA